jgi:putative transposase
MAQAVNIISLMGTRLPARSFISEVCYHYERRLVDENQEIADWLVNLTAAYRNWGFGLCFLYLRNVKKFTWNHKRVYRIYRELESNLRIKPKKRIVRDRPQASKSAVVDKRNMVEGLHARWSQRRQIVPSAQCHR